LLKKVFVAPSDIMVECENMDARNDLPETYMHIEKNSYMLRKIDGKHRLVPYSVEPSRVVEE